MKQATFLIFASLAYAGFGLGLLLIPDIFMSMFGVSLDGGGMLMARVLGSALLGFTFIFWWIRNDSDSSTVQAILRASFVYNLVDLPVVFLATQDGTMGILGWSAVILHMVLAFGFAYFAFISKPEAKQHDQTAHRSTA